MNTYFNSYQPIYYILCVKIFEHHIYKKFKILCLNKFYKYNESNKLNRERERERERK